MTDNMKAFVIANKIDLPIEIDGNPFEGLCEEEIIRIQMETQNLISYITH